MPNSCNMWLACAIAVLVLLASVCGAQDPVADLLATEWGTTEATVVELPWGTPADTMLLGLPVDGEVLLLDLTRHSLRAPGFTLRVFDGTSTQTVPAPAPTTYRGSVVGQPHRRVVASRTAVGWTGQVDDDAGASGTSLHFEPLRRYDPTAAIDAHLIFRPGPVSIACGVPDDAGAPAGIVNPPGSGLGTPSAAATGGGSPLGVGGGGGVFPSECDMKQAEIAFDCDFEYYTEQGSDVAATLARVEAILNTVDEFYIRDLRTTHLLTDVIVRTAPFYPDISGGTLLTSFRDEWNTNQISIPNDICHLMTDKTNLSGYAGLAYVGVVCTGSRYGWSVDSAGVVGHEIGHNWSAGHCLDPSPCNNMCGACLSIGPNTRDKMLQHRATRTCLTDVPNPIDPIPPYARLDEFLIEEAILFSRGSFTIDVLVNDHDTNCDPIHIASTDPISAEGGTVTIAPGGGSGGFDAVVYTPPVSGFSGNDTFEVAVGDGTFTTTGRVDIIVGRPELVGHWQLDETSGTTAFDSSGAGRNGALEGGADFSGPAPVGVFGGALSFDGIDDEVTIPAPAWQTNTTTITGWVRRNGVQADWAGLVFCRGGGTVAGLSLAPGSELRYHWNGTQFGWSSGLFVPDDIWCFFALVVEPTLARIHLQVGETGTLQTAAQSVTHPIEPFTHEVVLGHDTLDSVRYLTGSLDDVRVYRRALTPSEISEVIAGGGATAPRPRRFDNESAPHPILSWNPGHEAAAHDIYLGTDPAALAVAGPTSPEFRGRHDTSDTEPLPPLDLATTYLWSVDTVLSDGTMIEGEVWQFTTTSTELSEDLRLYYPLDLGTTTATSVFDASGPPVSNGTVQGGAAAISAPLGSALDLDGVNDRIAVAPLDLNTNTLTLSAWIRRDGPQSNWAGIIFSRAGSTASGLNFGTNEELRFHWNFSGQWQWNSGLVVPDGEWCHVALVVEPTRATIYLDGVGRVRNATLDPEEFDGTLLIGHDSFGNRYFDGAIDEVAIWTRALSANEIGTIHAAGRLGRPLLGDGDLDPPSPSPLAWDLPPTAVGENAIEMRAIVATDVNSVEYFFDCISGPGSDSGWRQSPYYLDDTLPPSASATYVVWARDRSPNENEGLPALPESAETEGLLFRRGDANGDGSIDIGDGIRILAHLFSGDLAPCLLACDANDSEAVDIADAIALLGHLFQGTGPLPMPFANCGGDPTGGALTCPRQSGCP